MRAAGIVVATSHLVAREYIDFISHPPCSLMIRYMYGRFRKSSKLRECRRRAMLLSQIPAVRLSAARREPRDRLPCHHPRYSPSASRRGR